VQDYNIYEICSDRPTVDTRWECGDAIDHLDENKKYFVVSGSGIHDIYRGWVASMHPVNFTDGTQKARFDTKLSAWANGTKQWVKCYNSQTTPEMTLLMKPTEIFVTSGRVVATGWIKKASEGYTKMLQYWQRYIKPLQGVVFDYHLDMYNLTESMPLKTGDGIHALPIVYRVVLDEILYKFMHPEYEFM
jgi:hypothetical protein